MFIDYNNKRYTFSRIDEIKNITLAEKIDMSYDSCIKHNMHAVEWKLISMINKDKTLIKRNETGFRDIQYSEKFLIYHLAVIKCL